MSTYLPVGPVRRGLYLICVLLSANLALSQDPCAGDTEAPEIICPPNLTIECGNPTDPGATGLPVVNDNCDPSPVLTFNDLLLPSCGPADTIYREWTATDAQGNQASCMQRIEVLDTQAPDIQCPPDENLGENPVNIPMPDPFNAQKKADT